MKNIAIFGCTKYTKHLIESIKDDFKIKYLITISPELGDRFAVAGYLDLKDYARKNDIEIYIANKYTLKNLEDIDNIKKMSLDLAFVQGWQRLIPPKVLSAISIGAFGMHGSFLDLPYGKGRSPLNWSIIEGDKCFYTNLFKYNEGVDSGDILDTFKFDINDQDTAETLHYKNAMAMVSLIKINKENLLSGKLELKKQNNDAESFYLKRTPGDSIIDWSNDIYSIERHIRAVTKPFNGAYTFLNDKKVTIYRAQNFSVFDFGFKEEPSGKVLTIFDDKSFLVKCMSGLLLVLEYESEEKIEAGNRFDNSTEEIKYFKRNRYGRFDV